MTASMLSAPGHKGTSPVPGRHRIRGLATGGTLVVLAAVAALLACRAGMTLLTGPRVQLDAVLTTAVAAVLALVVSAWLARTAVDVVRLSLAAEAGLPVTVGGRRARVAALLVGLTIGGSAGPAVASGHQTPVVVASVARSGDTVSPDLPISSAHEPVSPDLDPVPSQPRDAGTSSPSVPAPAPAAVRRSTSRDTDTVVVHRGDTLWSIAAEHLPPGASPAAVARACRSWHELNRDVVGPDPDLIRPGQVLHVPRRG